MESSSSHSFSTRSDMASIPPAPKASTSQKPWMFLPWTLLNSKPFPLCSYALRNARQTVCHIIFHFVLIMYWKIIYYFTFFASTKSLKLGVYFTRSPHCRHWCSVTVTCGSWLLYWRVQPWQAQFSPLQVGKLRLGEAVLQIRVCRASALSVRKAVAVLQFKIMNWGTPHWSKR